MNAKLSGGRKRKEGVGRQSCPLHEWSAIAQSGQGYTVTPRRFGHGAQTTDKNLKLAASSGLASGDESDVLQH